MPRPSHPPWLDHHDSREIFRTIPASMKQNLRSWDLSRLETKLTDLRIVPSDGVWYVPYKTMRFYTGYIGRWLVMYLES
jgi:hypothetical protein